MSISILKTKVLLKFWRALIMLTIQYHKFLQPSILLLLVEFISRLKAFFSKSG